MPNPPKDSLDALLRAEPSLWRGARMPERGLGALSTGFEPLDAALPSSGWPNTGLVEILHAQHGLGEWQLLLPALAQLSQHTYLACIKPPMTPYAPALAQAGVVLDRMLWLTPESDANAWWAIETALRSRACGAVVAWPGQIRADHVRRLQIAALEGRTLGFLMRPDGRTAPHVTLRLRVSRTADGQAWVNVEKARGSHRTPRVPLPC